MDTQGLGISNMEFSFGQHCDANPSYLSMGSEASSRSTPACEYVDSSPHMFYSDENGSFSGSPAPPVSPMMNSLLPCFQSPVSSSGFASPGYARLGSATPSLQHSPRHMDLEASVPSTPTSSQDPHLKSSLSSSSSSSSFSSSYSSSLFTMDPLRIPPGGGGGKPDPAMTAPGAKQQPGQDYPVICLFPGCTVKPFRRRADLDRHYKHCHATNAQKISFNCDYPRCCRRKDPFHRLDHFRDHLRDFHKEDIEKRGGTASHEWSGDRRVSLTWWRCPKCLDRIYIEHHGYKCPHCKMACQAKRKEARRRS